MRAFTLTLTLVGFASLPVLTQAPLAPPAFAVASIKPNTSGEGYTFFQSPPGGLVTVTNIALRDLIAEAYGIERTLQRFVLTGGPAALLSSRYDISAKPPEGVHPRAEVLLMLRTLLADRFGLKTHTETRQVPVYAITVVREGRLGPEMYPSQHDCAALYMSGARATGANPPVDRRGKGLCWGNYDFGPTMGVRFAGSSGWLATRGAQPYVDRPVIDATGLAGNYECQITFTMTPSPESEAPSIFTAFQEQLGLKLEPRTGPIEVRVIDSVEAPAPN